jgi:streptogramin lyase
MRCVGRAAVTRNAVRMAVAVVALLCGGVLSGPAAAAPTITEYAAGNASYGDPLSIVSAPDGKLWFSANEAPAGFGVVSTSGSIAKIGDSERPRDLAIGPEGDLWSTDTGGLFLLEPPEIEWGSTTSEPYAAAGTIALPLGSDPVGIAPGPNGDMWFTEGGGTGSVVEVDPQTEATHEFSKGLASGGEPAEIVEGADGAMWFTENGSGEIGRITTGGAITRYKTASGSSAPWGIARGPDGDVWFTEMSKDKVGRITPSGEIAEYGEGLTQSEPGEIVAADDGDLYFSERGGEGAIGQITPSGQITEYKTGLTVKNEPWGITTGPDGNVWFTELRESKIGRLTIAPGIVSSSAGEASEDGVELEASVLANSQASTLAFEYGPAESYGSTSAAVAVGSGSTAASGSVPLEGLAPSTTYHYRALATNASGTTYGPDGTFTTAAASPTEEPPAEEPPAEEPPAEEPASEEPPPSEEPAHGEEPPPGEAPSPGEEPPRKETPTGPSPGEEPPAKAPEETKPPAGTGPTSTARVAAPTPLSTDLPVEPLTPADPATMPPVLGRSGAVSVSSGIVLVRDPQTGRFVPVSGLQDVPVGATLDTTNGVLSLTTALPDGREQSATIWGGRFRFRQSRYGRIQLYLRGAIGPCRVRGHGGAGLGAPLASAAKHDAKRELWSKDSHGRYTTHGANSAATVLGTEWLTVDSCSGTLTRVRRGHVKVRDLREHRNVVLGPGQSYLARG